MHSRKIFRSKKLCPIQWAKDTVAASGAELAHQIARENKRPFIGKDNVDKNPFAAWYERAHQWLTKNAPIPNK